MSSPQAPTPTVEDLLKKIREDVEKAMKEAEGIISSAQQSMHQLTLSILF